MLSVSRRNLAENDHLLGKEAAEKEDGSEYEEEEEEEETGKRTRGPGKKSGTSYSLYLVGILPKP